LNPIEAHTLTKQFGKLTAVNNLDLRVAQGEFFGLADRRTTLCMSLFIMLTVSTFVGSVVACLAGLFTNSYLLDAKILFQFAAIVVPVLVAQTLLSFYYQINDSIATLCIAGLGILLLATPKIILGRLDTRWKSTMFKIA